jgi:hypothetical protein
MVADLETLQAARAINVEILAESAAVQRSCKRYLKWFFWTPGAVGVRSTLEYSLRLTQELEASDRWFDQYLGPR